jgi:flagellar hook-length control protein FliK
MPDVSILKETKGDPIRTISQHRMEKVNVEGVDPGTKLSGRPSVSVPTVKLGAESIPLHVVNQVGRRISLAVKRGENHLKIRLKPPDLGSIQLEMSMKDNALRVAMLAEHQSVKEVLMSHISDLRQTLMQQGIELQKVDVEIDYSFGQSMANAQKDLNGVPSRRGGSISRPKSPDLESGLDEISPIRPEMNNDYSLLDVFA